MRHRVLAMLPAMALAMGLAPSLAKACEGVISTSEWRSDLSVRGYYAASFMMRNTSARTVRVLVIPRGDGAVLAPPVVLAAGASAKAWPFRSSSWMTPAEIQAAVTLQCTMLAPG